MKLQIPEKIQHLFSDQLLKKLVDLRHDLHRYPELSFQEKRTAEKLHEALSSLNPVHVERVAGTGIIARIKGRKSGFKKVALRGDIDALPIQEDTDISFASVHAGVMHACGHDVHAAWTIGAAHLLTLNPPRGDVWIVLQPAEELGKGALEILKSESMKDVSAIFGGHVDPHFTVGQVVADHGPIAASTDAFEIVFRGKGSHGARPQEANDPIVGSAAFIMGLQTIVSRRLDPAIPGVLSVGSVKGGSAPNIIPESVELSGTLRAIDPETRELLIAELKRIGKATAEAYHLETEIEIQRGTPSVVNHEKPAEMARQAVVSVLGEEALVPMDYLNMGGEDFAYYLDEIPGCFLRIGARKAGETRTAAHSPHFYVPDECLFVGAAVLAETARVASEWLNPK